MKLLFTSMHHLAILVMFFCTLVTIRQLWQPFSIACARILIKTDMVNGIAATLVLLVGLIRVFYFEKGSAYYFDNELFLAKLGFYGLASALSIIPTLEIYRWRAALKSGQLPTVSTKKFNAMRAVAVLQLGCLCAMALLANLVARGL
jgi:putative membrane protein